MAVGADECNITSATTRFPFQSSQHYDGTRSGTALMDVDDRFDTEGPHALSLLQADSALVAEPESIENELEFETRAILKPETDFADNPGQDYQFYKGQSPPFIYRAPRWDSLLSQESNITTSHQVSMMPHRIATSDQQRFATAHEMAVEETADVNETDENGMEEEGEMKEEEEDEKKEEEEQEQEKGKEEYNEEARSTYYEIETPSPSTTDPSSAEKVPIRVRGPPRFYATPIVKDDPNSTPPLLYGLEQPSEHKVRPKKRLRPRSYYAPATAPVRPTSRQGPSPLSSAFQPGIAEDTEEIPMPMRRLSALFRRPYAYAASNASGPGESSTYFSGSASTVSTVRSVATAATDYINDEPLSNTTTPASSIINLLNTATTPDPKPASDLTPAPHSTSSPVQEDAPAQNNSRPATPSSPRLLRRRTTLASSETAASSPRRNSIFFNFSFRKPASSHMAHSNQKFMRSAETLGTILAAGEKEDVVRPTTSAGNISLSQVGSARTQSQTHDNRGYMTRSTTSSANSINNKTTINFSKPANAATMAQNPEPREKAQQVQQKRTVKPKKGTSLASRFFTRILKAD